LIVEQQVEVEGARRMVELAAATKAALDDEQGVEQLLRVKHGLMAATALMKSGWPRIPTGAVR
jgi:hypothetical protein